ncbi:unnamed protein product [Tetraodon nigroviridis]|nr:unnamed protein product [Tetraodon nigroviridis]
MTLPSSNMGAKTKLDALGVPNVPFPPELPTSENLHDICHSGHARPRYPPSFFPKSGVSHYRRRGKAINRLESWFTYCCDGQVAQGDDQILCCSKQAWKQALSTFCTEEYSTKTVAYSCCQQSGDSRWLCFEGKLPTAKYSPTPDYTAPPMPEEPGFTFDANAC